MMRPKIKLIKATRDKGCALACLAMILGSTEDEIDKDFNVDFNRGGITVDLIDEYLRDAGLSVISKQVGSFINLQNSNKRMLQPFAHAHIVIVQSRIDSKRTHAVVMSAKGKLFDPAAEPYARHYYVKHVLGVFWD